MSDFDGSEASYKIEGTYSSGSFHTADERLREFDNSIAIPSVHVSVDNYAETQERLDSLENSADHLDGINPDIEVGIDGDVDSLSANIQEQLEDATIQVQTTADLISDDTDEVDDTQLQGDEGTDVDGTEDVKNKTSSAQRALYAFDGITATSNIHQTGAENVQDSANSAQSSLNDFDGTVATAQMNVETDDEEVQEQAKGIQQTFDDLDDSESGISLPGDGSGNLTAAFQSGIPDSVSSLRQSSAFQKGVYSLSGIFGGGDDEDLDLTEAQDNIREIGAQISSLPDHSFDIKTKADLAEYQSQLQSSNRMANLLGETLGEFDDDVGDSILQQSDSIEALRRNLQKTDKDTERLNSSLGRLEGASRDLVSSMISQSKTTEELDERTDKVGSQAKRTAKSISGLSSTVSGYVVSAWRGADSSEEFVDELQDVGSQALKTRLKVSAATGTFQDFAESMSNVGTSFGPFATTLGSVTKILPMMGSLIAALGGVATAGGAAGGVLAGIFGGGLLKAGEQMADTLEATGQASEEMRKAEGAQRAMLGLEKIMGRLREKAYEALEPLRQPEFAQFSLDVLNGAVELLGRLAKTAASLSEPALGWADDIGNAFWATLPAILEEVEKSMLAIGPILRDLAVGAIEALPAILALMRRHAEKLLPPLMDIGDAFMDALPGLLAFGQGMLQLLLPILEGALKGIAAISPLLRALGGLFSWLADSIVVGPILEFVGAILGIGAVASMIPGLGALVSLLVKIGAMLSGSGVLAGMSFSGLGLSGLLGPLGVILAVVGALLTIFNKWDEAIKLAIQSWNVLVDVVEWGANFIVGMMEGMAKGVARAFVGMGEMLPDWVPLFGNLENQGIDPSQMDIGTARDYSGMKMDPNAGDGLASKLNSPLGGQKQTPTPQQTGGEGSSNLSGDTYNQQTQNIVDNVTVQGTGNEARVESAVRRGLEQANKRQRMRNTDMNS